MNFGGLQNITYRNILSSEAVQGVRTPTSTFRHRMGIGIVLFFTVFVSSYKMMSYEGKKSWRVEWDTSRTPQTQSIQLLVTLYKKRSMGMLISLGQPIDASRPYKKGILSQHRPKSSEIPIFVR